MNHSTEQPPALAGYLLSRFARDAQPAEKTAFLQSFSQVMQALESGDTVSPVPAALPKHQNLCITSLDASAGKAAPLVHDGERLWLYRIWQQEKRLAQSVLSRLALTPPAITADLAPYLKGLESAQQRAIEHACAHSLTIITGGPGTGKTYTVARLTALLAASNPDIRIALTAPTGKAAMRMQESLMAALCADSPLLDAVREAKTLHRLLGIGTSGIAKYHADNPIDADLVIVDEASMLSLELAGSLFAAVPAHARLVLLGDADQLAAVEPGAVLHDISAHPKAQAACVQLTVAKRFAGESPVAQLANAVLKPPADFPAAFDTLMQNEHLNYQAFNQDFYQTAAAPFADYFQSCEDCRQGKIGIEDLFTAFDRYRILCASKHGFFGTRSINAQLRAQHCLATGQNIDSAIYHGLPLMITANDYASGLFNGDIGLCLAGHDGQISVHFPQHARPIPIAHINQASTDTAYAMTIHKSQGSEFQHAAIVLDSQHEQLLVRELLYTGITRAKTAVSLYGTKETIENCANRPARRTTGLAVFLDQESHAETAHLLHSPANAAHLAAGIAAAQAGETSARNFDDLAD